MSPRPSQCAACGCFEHCLNPSAAQCAERIATHVDECIADEALADASTPIPAPTETVPTLVDLRTASAHEINTALKHWRGWRLAFDTSAPTDAPLDWDITPPEPVHYSGLDRSFDNHVGMGGEQS